MKFKPGDIVKLKTHAVPMVVGSIVAGLFYSCYWLDVKNRPCECLYPEATLVSWS